MGSTLERFNGRISEIVKQARFACAAELESTLTNYLNTYNGGADENLDYQEVVHVFLRRQNSSR